jgi:hypothetical protein
MKERRVPPFRLTTNNSNHHGIPKLKEKNSQPIEALFLDLLIFQLAVFSTEGVIQELAMRSHYHSLDTDISQHIVSK